MNLLFFERVAFLEIYFTHKQNEPREPLERICSQSEKLLLSVGLNFESGARIFFLVHFRFDWAISEFFYRHRTDRCSVLCRQIFFVKKMRYEIMNLIFGFRQALGFIWFNKLLHSHPILLSRLSGQLVRFFDFLLVGVWGFIWGWSFRLDFGVWVLFRNLKRHFETSNPIWKPKPHFEILNPI